MGLKQKTGLCENIIRVQFKIIERTTTHEITC